MEKNSVQIQRRLTRITQPNDKLTGTVMNLELEAEEYASNINRYGKYYGAIVEREKPRIATEYTIKLEEGYRDLKALNQFDKAVLAVCISELSAGNNSVTLDRIFRGLTGGKVHDSTRLTSGMKSAIFESVKRMMKTLIEIDASQTVKGMKYPDMPIRLVSAILPAVYEERMINGQVVSTIHFLQESPLMIFARSKNYQVLTYQTKLLNIPNLRHTPRVIKLKFYIIERVLEIVNHGMIPTITFEDVFKHCGLVGATKWQKQDARSTIKTVMEHLKAEGLIKNFDLDRDGDKYRAIIIKV